MRVISGFKKGHKLKQPKTEFTRPTEDRIKESVFNIIGSIDEDSEILDLFAGSGAIGIEFLSRGAKKAYFIDDSSLAISTIKENLKHTKLNDQAVVIKGKDKNVIEKLANQNKSFDYIYLDPPFDDTLLLKNSITLLFEKNIVKNKSLIIIEHKSDYKVEENENYEIKDVRRYGNKSVTFLLPII